MVVDPKNNIKQLYQRALCIAAAAILPPLPMTISFIIKDSVGEACSGHPFRAREEWPQNMVEHLWVAMLVHPVEKSAKFLKSNSNVP